MSEEVRIDCTKALWKVRHQKLPESRNSDYVTRPSSKISARFTLPTVPQVTSFSKKYIYIYIYNNKTVLDTTLLVVPTSSPADYTHIKNSKFERRIFFTVWSLIYINQDWPYKVSWEVRMPKIHRGNVFRWAVENRMVHTVPWSSS